MGKHPHNIVPRDCDAYENDSRFDSCTPDLDIIRAKLILKAKAIKKEKWKEEHVGVAACTRKNAKFHLRTAKRRIDEALAILELGGNGAFRMVSYAIYELHRAHDNIPVTQLDTSLENKEDHVLYREDLGGYVNILD